MRGIKNRGKLKKEGLITSLLKSEISSAESNYMKCFNTNASNTNASNNTDDDTYDDTYDGTCDGKTRDKISDIRVIFRRWEI